MRTISARFAGTSQNYSYFVPEGDEPCVGDLLVTSVHWTTEETDEDGDPINPALTLSRDDLGKILIANGKMAIVTGIQATIDPKADKFYVALLPLVGLKQRRDQNFQLSQKVKRQREARLQLDRMLRDQDSTERYRALAKINPQAAMLLAEIEGNSITEAPKSEPTLDEILPEPKRQPQGRAGLGTDYFKP